MMGKFANRLPAKQPGSVYVFLATLAFLLSACAPSSGIFAGGSWQASALQNQHLQVLAVDPNHLRNIYAGDAQNGVFISTDAGMTWKPSNTGLPLPLNIHALSFDIPGKQLYAATSTGLFVSSDSAAHWHAVEGVPSDRYTTLTFDINSPHTVYAGTEHSGVLKSTDDGISWTHVSTGLPSGALTSLLYDPSQKQLWAAFTDALYRSDDGGASWHAMSNGIPPNAGINALALGAVTVSNTGLIFAGTQHGFFRTSDAGQHWSQSQFSLANLHIYAILLDANSPNTVYISTNIGVLRSRDSGQNWDQLGSGLPEGQSIGGLVQGSDSNARLFAAARGVYFYPGSGGIFNPAQLVPTILVLLFFYLLYRFFVAGRRRSALRPADGLAPHEQPGEPTSENMHSPDLHPSEDAHQ